MLMSLLVALTLAPTPAAAVETCPLPVSAVGPDLNQAKGALEKVKKASEPVVSGKARVVVLSTGRVNDNNPAMRRTVGSLLPRFDLTYVSDVDLDQEGRVRRDTTLQPADQPGAVPASTLSVLRGAVDDISSVQPSQMKPASWEGYAEELRALTAQVWFVDRPELRAPLFNLYYQVGRAAENAGIYDEPYFRTVDGNNLNYYYFLAASLADGDPDLLKASADEDQRAVIKDYLQYLDAGRIDRAQIPLDLDNQWDATAFFDTYELVVNGRLIEADALPAKARASLTRDGILEVAPGVVDVMLRRKDGGAGMAERREILKPDDPIPPLRADARAAVAGVLVRALKADTGGCSASIPKGIAASLALYGKAHKEPVYVAMARDDDPAQTEVWLLDADNLSLQKVLAPGGNFPVRFAGLIGAGLTINGATFQEPTLSSSGRVGRPDIELGVGYAPLFAHLRGHYKHLVVGVGGEVGVPVGATFADRHALPDGLIARDESGNEVLKSPSFNRLLFIQAGYMHGNRAAEGMGIRALGRIGWYDVPHTIDLSLHGGLTVEGPVAGEGRIASILDFNAFVGMMVPFGSSMFERPLANFGVTAGAGTTF
jgi:hypothetical protein